MNGTDFSSSHRSDSLRHAIKSRKWYKTLIDMDLHYVPYHTVKRVIKENDVSYLYTILLIPDYRLSDNDVLSICDVLLEGREIEKKRIECVNHYFHLLGIKLKFGTEPKFNRR